MRIAIAILLAVELAPAQSSVGSIAGTVQDSSGADVRGAQIKAVNVATRFARSTFTTEFGTYSIPALFAGEYEVTVEATGFASGTRTVSVETGLTTNSDFSLAVGDIHQTVTVGANAPLLHYDTHTVSGIVSEQQVRDLPLNGRGYLELAKLEPGVQPPTRINNRTFVPALGQPDGNNGRGTRVTVDGGSVMTVGSGGSAMNFSQEAVAEFQVSTVNPDLSAGATDGAAINVVTRSGGNELHGTALYFFRDHTLTAYPALQRDAGNPDPFFQRRQFGLAVGGPLRRDRVFYFANWERNEQRGVAAATLITPEFSKFSRVTPSPFFANQANVRLDGRIATAHTAFLRYSHDGSHAFGGDKPGSYPSTWSRQIVWSDQSVLGITSVINQALVNDFRFSYFYSSLRSLPGEHDCPGCLGGGAPAISVANTDLQIGLSSRSSNAGRRFHWNDSLAWQNGARRMRFGFEWEHSRSGNLQWADEPATITLYSPNEARRNGIATPAEFATLNDILQLPLKTATVAVGDPAVLEANGSFARTWDTVQFYAQDTWRVHKRLTVNYGIGWLLDRSLNYNLRKPSLLAPLLGADGLGPTRRHWKDFSPVLGLAWSPSRDGLTVIRAGAGIYYEFFGGTNSPERAALGPPGLGRQTYPGTSIGLDFSAAPTSFTGQDLLAILPGVRADLLRRLAAADQSVQQIQISKIGGALNPVDVPERSALHESLGVQRMIGENLVVSADLVYRHFVHYGFGGPLDLNHFDSARGPVIPKCTASEQSDPQAQCSNGPITVFQGAARAAYRGLLVRAEKRFSRGLQFVGSWAYSRNTAHNSGNGFNLDNWLENHGPLAFDETHILNVSGVKDLPRGFQAALNFSYSSAPPFSAYVGGIDFNGDGTKGDLLPGSSVNAFNRGMSLTDLARLVDQFNSIYAGRLDGAQKPRLIPVLRLPQSYRFDDSYQAIDLRVSKVFSISERWRFRVIGEVFNLYNAANLSGFSGDLTSPAFGQPTARYTHVFGSGGPRAFQIAVRGSF